MSTPPFRETLIPPPDRLFDVHVNVGVTDSHDVSFGRMTKDAYLRVMEASGTAQACVFPPLMEHYRAANESLAAWAGEVDADVLPFARLGGPNLTAPVRTFWQARKRVRSWIERRPPDVGSLDRYAGVKMIPHMSGVPSDPLFDEIASRRLPVLVHAGSDSPPSWIETALLPRTRGPLLLAHLGAFPCSTPDLEDAVDLARRHQRVYLDTSGAWHASFLRYAADRVPRKLVFGSDAPMVDPRVAWHHLASAVRDDDVLERIAFRTAESLFDRENR